MTARFYPVPESKIDKIFPFLEMFLSEMEVPKLMTLDHIKKTIVNMYSSKLMAAYVDDFNKPKHVLLLSTVPALFTEGLVTTVHLIYSLPEDRGNRDIVKAMHTTIDNYAKFTKAGKIVAGSWVFRGSRGIDPFWKRYGYEIQEKVYTKELP